MSALTDLDLRVRAIRRFSRIYDVFGKFIFDAPCKWTRRGRAKHRQFHRVFPRVRDEYQLVVGPLNPFQLLRGVAYEDAAEAHVEGCRCGRCPRTPPRRKP